MNLNVSFDQAVGTLAPGLVAAVNYVVNYFDALFTNNVTVNIHLGYGEAEGSPLSAGDLGESQANFASVSYQQAVGAFESAEQVGPATLPGSSPFAAGTLWLTTAQERALDFLPANSAEIDGWVGVSNTTPFSYAANVTPAPGEYYFIGVLEHEFTEVMGRVSFIGAHLGGTQSYSLMDLYRFSAPGAHQTGTGTPAYFSIDNGITNLDNWNTNVGGDLGDWAASAGPDAFLAFSPSGHIENISTADLTLMNAIGWNTSNLAVSNTTIPAVAVEASMYGAVGTQAEVNMLATQFLPAQVANAIQNGLNPQVYACEALGLAFAFGNENGSSAFANNYGPSNPSMPNSAPGDAAFAAAASSAIFGSAATANLAAAIDGYVANWKSFYSLHGISGITQPSQTQIDIAARGAAWGDAVGLALANNLGALLTEATTFVSHASQGTAIYSAPLTSQATEVAMQPVGLSEHPTSLL
jgi:hypothetical protein